MRAGTMAGWGSGLSLTPRLLVTSHEGQSLDCTSAAETSGSPDFLHISFFSPVKAHLMGAGRGKGLTLHESGLEECLWEGRKIFHCPLHRTRLFIRYSTAAKVTTRASRDFDVRIFLMPMPPSL